jgi:hypothetical protein
MNCSSVLDVDPAWAEHRVRGAGEALVPDEARSMPTLPPYNERRYATIADRWPHGWVRPRVQQACALLLGGVVACESGTEPPGSGSADAGAVDARNEDSARDTQDAFEVDGDDGDVRVEPDGVPTAGRCGSPAVLDPAAERAVDRMLRGDLEQTFDSLVLGVLDRRYDEARLDGQAELAARAALEFVGNGVEPLLGKFNDRDFPADEADITSMEWDTDRFVVQSLYCDRFGTPPEMAAEMQADADLFSEGVTHQLLALVHQATLGCELPIAPGATPLMLERTRALIGSPDEVFDQQIESAVFLALAGRHDLVDPAFVEFVASKQLPDGGWPRDLDEDFAHWHTTPLGTWLMYECSGRERLAGVIDGGETLIRLE